MALILGRHPITTLKKKSFTDTFNEVGVTAPSVFATAFFFFFFFWKDSKIPRKKYVLELLAYIILTLLAYIMQIY